MLYFFIDYNKRNNSGNKQDREENKFIERWFKNWKTKEHNTARTTVGQSKTRTWRNDGYY